MKYPLGSMRLAELVATLSIATDLGTGHPMERALRACLFAIELGDAYHSSQDTLADIYYVTLLRFAGCAADARHRAALFGDEIAMGVAIDAVELWQQEPMLAFLHTHGFDRLPPDEFQTLMATGIQRSVEAAIATCEIGQLIAGRLGLGASVLRGLGDVFERWDGAGVPGRVRGEAIAIAARVATFALDAELHYRIGGAAAVQHLAQQRSGGQYDPMLATYVQTHPSLCTVFTTANPWEAVLEREPGPRPLLAGAQFDDGVRAIADFADLRLPYTIGHSTAVAALCHAAARRLRLPDADGVALHHAASIHDVGMAAISVRIWDTPGPLNAGAWEQVRLHPYFTERIVARSPALRTIAQIASCHHERLDGTGYHRHMPTALLPITARILAVAETYRSMIEPRPYRDALAPAQAAAELRAQAAQGWLDPDAVAAVLDVAGHPSSPTRRTHPAGLSDREVDVLCLLAQGMTNKQMAQALTVAPATIDHHVRHIYTKIGCSTRLAATMFAMEHRLVG